jgi:choline transport protein
MTSWTSTIAWQAGNAQGVLLVGTLIQTMIFLNNEDYAFPNYQGTLLAFAAILIGITGTIFGSKVLPYWQNAVFLFHVLAFFAWLVPVWVYAPKATHHQVWFEWDTLAGWNNIGLAVMIGQLTGISNNVGIDTCAHMSEETKNANKTVPMAMLACYLINFIITFPAFVTICYAIPDLDAALNDPTAYPFLYVLQQSMSTAWVTVIVVITVVILIASNIVYLAAVSRDLFAFARDRGVPFSSWLSKVHPRRHIPENAIITSSVISAILALIYIGSPTAFYALTSLLTVALLQCYTFSISCMLYRRIYLPHTLPPATWPLGKFGVPINAAAVIFGLYCFFWAFWPQSYPVTAEGFNWASPVYAAVLIFALGYFAVKARKQYFGPVTVVEGRRRTD